MPQPIASTIYCINPDCPRPFPQTWGNKFCNSCGSLLQLRARYVPMQKLGSGGFATIYTIWDLATQTERVLKVLIEPSPKARELFEQEAAVLTSLRHPGVPRVEADGYFQLSLGNPPARILPCLVMEKINGKTLEEVLESYPQGCPEAWVLNWFTQAVEILRELHKRRIIHRDLKPSNLMLRQDTNQIVMIDFGGAKKIRPRSRSQASSTRLYSPGYSPPEQSQGLDVEPTADFYALGRTMIHLLTGRPPQELEDSRIGELRWRNLASVNPVFADLLDEMVQKNARQRPQTAVSIQKRLGQISQVSVRQVPISKLFRQLAQNSLDQSRGVTRTVTKGLSQTTNLLLNAIIRLGQAGWDTIKAMVLSAIATCIATAIGFIFAYWSPLGAEVANLMYRQLPELFRNNRMAVGSEIIIFAAAGLGTAWGLTAARSFGQKQRYFLAPFMGLLGYGLGWIVGLAVTPYKVIAGIVGLIAVAVTFVTLGLSLKSHYLVHAVVAVIGTITVFASLVVLNLFPAVILQLPPQPSWINFWIYIVFFGFMSLILSFWLGISYYIIVPCLRLLGWR